MDASDLPKALPADATDELYRLIADTIPQIVWSARTDGSGEFHNARASEYYGIEAARLAGEGWRAMVHPDDLPGCLAAWHKAVAGGTRMVRERFGVDPDTCTGDHSCIRLSGCPSLTIKSNPDPLRQDPIAHVDNTCVGCGVCGEVAHAAVLCPSFYRARLLFNPTRWDRVLQSLRSHIIGFFQRRAERRRLRHAF